MNATQAAMALVAALRAMEAAPSDAEAEKIAEAVKALAARAAGWEPQP